MQAPVRLGRPPSQSAPGPPEGKSGVAAPGHRVVAGIIGKGLGGANGGGQHRDQRHGAGFGERSAVASRDHAATPARPGHAPARCRDVGDVRVADDGRGPASARLSDDAPAQGAYRSGQRASGRERADAGRIVVRPVTSTPPSKARRATLTSVRSAV